MKAKKRNTVHPKKEGDSGLDLTNPLNPLSPFNPAWNIPSTPADTGSTSSDCGGGSFDSGGGSSDGGSCGGGD